MATISTSGISAGQIIRSEHLLRVINALNGVNPIDIIITGSLSVSGSTSFTGSTYLKGLPNTSRANVITYDPITGQLSYLNSASLGVTMSVSQPGGSNTQIQYNSGSVLAANSSFTFNYLSSSLQNGNNVIANGTFAHAQGNQTTSSGQYSHAEGATTQAKGLGSHAEGTSTIASGSYSHAEGSGNIAQGLVSHAEGVLTLALGAGAHSEGNYTTASGNYSHAEGGNTFAVGNYSHAEGNQTVALGNYQHVQGQFNISSSAESAFIIGNGTSDSTRSNLVFASESLFQITGSLNVTGSALLASSSIINWGSSTSSTSSFSAFIDNAGRFQIGNSRLTTFGAYGFKMNTEGKVQLMNVGSRNYNLYDTTLNIVGSGSNDGITMTQHPDIINKYTITVQSGSQSKLNFRNSLHPNSGSFDFSGSVNINNILTLAPRTTTPGSPTNGMVMVSGSGADQHIYCYLNSTWKQLD